MSVLGYGERRGDYFVETAVSCAVNMFCVLVIAAM